MISVLPQFQRSVKLDADLRNPEALKGYILQASPLHALETIAEHALATRQRAFTVTGPYGGGKSSLALAIAQLAGGAPQARRLAKAVLHLAPDSAPNKVFGKRPWIVIPVVGHRGSVEEAIGDAIDTFSPARGRKPSRAGRRDVIAELMKRAADSSHGGVLLILDELGRFLEGAASSRGDIHFYQELAESAGRAAGNLVVIGILHQSFDQYAHKAGRDVQIEWAKVQGRFVDVPIVPAADETVELIGRAIACSTTHPWSMQVSTRIAEAASRRRSLQQKTFAQSLDRCWPLHPVTAALLGPASRKRFGQNERSVFGFLSSAEPLAFRDFLKSHDAGRQAYYTPAAYWDYLKLNFESAILNSPDGHRWATCSEAVERAEAKYSPLHVSVVKTVALIELFRNGTGLTPELDVVRACFDEGASADVQRALNELSTASILIYRKHLGAWGVFAGSDFDIEGAVQDARVSMQDTTKALLDASSSLPPVSARRHYSETGTLRWFRRSAVPGDELASLDQGSPADERAARLVLVLPTEAVSEERAHEIAKSRSEQDQGSLTIFGAPRGRTNIIELCRELLAFEHVAKTNTALEGDSVARREIASRIQGARIELESALHASFSDATWYWDGKKQRVSGSSGLSPLTSQVCDKAFSQAPRIHSELVNRDSLSSSSAKAQRLLMHRMHAYEGQERLGYEGFPSDAGLYHTTLAELGLHAKVGGGWKFVVPSAPASANVRSVAPLWKTWRDELQKAQSNISLESLYAVARRRPFGLKEGVLPILALAFFLAHRSEIALYVDGLFSAELSEAGLDEWLQDPRRISWKWVNLDHSVRATLEELAVALEAAVGRKVVADPLDSARALVSYTLTLPAWTQRTLRLSEVSRQIRTSLLRASDPIKVIFNDLPQILGLGASDGSLVAMLTRVLTELGNAYPLALTEVRDSLFRGIDHSGSLEDLRRRGAMVRGATGDFMLDAFASRLESLSDESSSIEGLVSLAVSKPPKEFTDHDFDRALVQISRWAFEFRRVEAMLAVQGRDSGRSAIAVVFGSSGTVSSSFDVSAIDKQLVDDLARSFIRIASDQRLNRSILLAALAEAGSRTIEEEEASHG